MHKEFIKTMNEKEENILRRFNSNISYAFAFFYCSSFAQQFRRLYNLMHFAIKANCIKRWSKVA